jgi:hypothetical protein
MPKLAQVIFHPLFINIRVRFILHTVPLCIALNKFISQSHILFFHFTRQVVGGSFQIVMASDQFRPRRFFFKSEAQ